jgi:hypothetical protein
MACRGRLLRDGASQHLLTGDGEMLMVVLEQRRRILAQHERRLGFRDESAVPFT